MTERDLFKRLPPYPKRDLPVRPGLGRQLFVGWIVTRGLVVLISALLGLGIALFWGAIYGRMLWGETFGIYVAPLGFLGGALAGLFGRFGLCALLGLLCGAVAGFAAIPLFGPFALLCPFGGMLVGFIAGRDRDHDGDR